MLLWGDFSIFPQLLELGAAVLKPDFDLRDKLLQAYLIRQIHQWQFKFNFVFDLKWIVQAMQDVPTCVCVRPNEAASSALSGRAKYCVF